MSTLRTASKISLLTMVSRALGFLRDILMLRMLGATGAGTFLFAWLLPNMFRRLFGEGALTTAFIPAFTSALRDPDRDSARHLLASVSGILLLGLSALTAVVLFCWLLLPFDWFSGRG
ncbi:MAG: lipid II flippase MurJ, partial [Planctomycetota bacterium]|nr:lipid II flippase MurJ [Planctomycetota bacterium]